MGLRKNALRKLRGGMLKWNSCYWCLEILLVCRSHIARLSTTAWAYFILHPTNNFYLSRMSTAISGAFFSAALDFWFFSSRKRTKEKLVKTLIYVNFPTTFGLFIFFFDCPKKKQKKTPTKDYIPFVGWFPD